MGIKQFLAMVLRRVGKKMPKKASGIDRQVSDDDEANLSHPGKGSMSYVDGCASTAATHIAGVYDRAGYPNVLNSQPFVDDSKED